MKCGFKLSRFNSLAGTCCTQHDKSTKTGVSRKRKYVQDDIQSVSDASHCVHTTCNADEARAPVTPSLPRMPGTSLLALAARRALTTAPWEVWACESARLCCTLPLTSCSAWLSLSTCAAAAASSCWAAPTACLHPTCLGQGLVRCWKTILVASSQHCLCQRHNHCSYSDRSCSLTRIQCDPHEEQWPM